jgi:hypothetical protein
MWALVAMVDYQASSAGAAVAVMVFPVFLQLMVIMFIAIRSSQLLMNPQFHLIGIRKEIFINCFSVCFLFTLFIYDPKNVNNLLNAKLIMFAIFSTGCFWLIWIYSLQVLSMFIVGIIFLVSIWIGLVCGIKMALGIFNIAIWIYFAFWLVRSPLQRQFKFESFAGLVDYFVERLKLTRFKRLITQVNNKNHVLLMGEGDGYINRIFLSQMFSFVLTFFYVLAMRNMRELCLWMILLLLVGAKARLKVTQSHAKLWLLTDGDRLSQFNITENILLRLNIYPLVVSCMLLILWSCINPDLMAHGIGALFLSFLFVVVIDYCSGFVFQEFKFSAIILIFIKMIFMSVTMFMNINFIWYMVLVVILLGVGMFARGRAKRNFLIANFSARVV